MPRTYKLNKPAANNHAGRRIDYAQELNAQQCAAVTAGPGPMLVIAGAGSGKTRTLIYRVAYLLEQGIEARNILLLTFTNKAAREMLDRVSSLLTEGTDGLWGGTFHSIGNKILRRHAETLGFRRGFSIMDREDQEDLMKTVIAAAGIDPKEKRFPKAEVVGASVQTADPLIHLPAPGKYKHRALRVTRSHHSKHLGAVPPRQAEIQHHQCRSMLLRVRQGSIAIGDPNPRRDLPASIPFAGTGPGLCHLRLPVLSSTSLRVRVRLGMQSCGSSPVAFVSCWCGDNCRAQHTSRTTSEANPVRHLFHKRERFSNVPNQPTPGYHFWVMAKVLAAIRFLFATIRPWRLRGGKKRSSTFSRGSPPPTATPLRTRRLPLGSV